MKKIELLNSRKMMDVLVILNSVEDLYMAQIRKRANVCEKHIYDILFNLQRLDLVYIKKSEKHKGHKDNRRRYYRLTIRGGKVAKLLKEIINL